MNHNERNSFLLYLNFGKQLRKLSVEERGELITAIFDYEEHGHIETELSPRVDLVFSFIADTLDRDRKAYEARCEQNRENGKRGGRPPKKQTEAETDNRFPKKSEKTEGFSEKAKKADNDNDIDIDIDIGNDNESDSDNETENGNVFLLNRGGAPGALPTDTPCPSAPQKKEEKYALTDEEYLSLIVEGLDGAYIRTHGERASRYAAKHGIATITVLKEWWLKDSAQRPSGAPSRGDAIKAQYTPARSKVGELGCSFDEQDFFEAAVGNAMNWNGR
ncbi:MAG: hypothetical protein IJX80_02670 [Clostridia bacterium]|nr:hypothetical protein [Clostridia bacterium]